MFHSLQQRKMRVGNSLVLRTAMMYTTFLSVCKLKSLIVCIFIHTLVASFRNIFLKSNLIKATNFDQLKCCFCCVTLSIEFLTAVLMLCPLLSLRPEKAARVNWHLPTVRPEWAPTCEKDTFTRVCMLTAETATDQRIAQLSLKANPYRLPSVSLLQTERTK